MVLEDITNITHIILLRVQMFESQMLTQKKRKIFAN